ncbi:MAG: PQQ-binding-like beta-propeller repeat protein [Acidobacteria bacterium]|nr:PQQ-binding-like beta-propeller repeat protein [Acidobacteriota bacterium]
MIWLWFLLLAQGSPQEILWQYPVGDRIAGKPAVHARWIAVATVGGTVFVLESGTAHPLWRDELGEPIQTGPVIRGSLLFAVTAAGVVRSWNLETGARQWERTLDGGTISPMGSWKDSPLWVALENGGMVGLSLDTGEIVDRKDFLGTPATPPVSCGDRILIGTRSGRLLGFQTGEAEPVWELSCGNDPTSTPTCYGNTALVGCGNYLYRIGLKKGKVRWRYRAGGLISARPLVRDNRIYFASYDNYLYVLKRRSGHLIGFHPATHRVRIDPVILGDLFLNLPETSGEIEVRHLPDLETISRIPLPRGAASRCTSPVLASRETVVLGCGEENSFLLFLRPDPAGKFTEKDDSGTQASK